MKWGVIGCGLIGRKRAMALQKGELVSAYDLAFERAEQMRSIQPDVQPVQSIEELLSLVDVVVVATNNASLTEITRQCLSAGRHVLVEKPAGIRSQDLVELNDLAIKKRLLVRVGFNHRFHPAFVKAREIFESGALGRLMFIRARYGHGGRVGYEKEWRFDKEQSGGGELLDQGVHLIDLSRMFLPELSLLSGTAFNYFWNMSLDDNAFLHLLTPGKQSAWLQVSCTEWKNLFHFEVYGEHAKLVIEGLGGSYGVEKLYHYQMSPQMGPPDTTIYEYPQGDKSWSVEIAEFRQDIASQRPPVPGLLDAARALQIVEEVYNKSGIIRAER
jgi:predicted dehydrogenase